MIDRGMVRQGEKTTKASRHFFFIMIRLLRKDTVCKPSANVASSELA